MSEESNKEAKLESSPKKRQAKTDDTAELKAQIETLTACLEELATHTGYRSILSKYNLKPYEITAADTRKNRG